MDKRIIKREKIHNFIMQNYGIYVHDFVNNDELFTLIIQSVDCETAVFNYLEIVRDEDY